MLTDFHGDEAKINLADSKKTECLKTTNSQYFFTKNFRDWSLGKCDKLKGTNVAQSMWSSGCTTSAQERDENTFHRRLMSIIIIFLN